jgi:uncharacterized membrane protein
VLEIAKSRLKLVGIALALLALIFALVLVPETTPTVTAIKIGVWGAFASFGFMWLVLKFFSLLKATDDERRAEDRAREYFQQTGRWPDEG